MTGPSDGVRGDVRKRLAEPTGRDKAHGDRQSASASLAETLGDIRVAGARQADWWTNDSEHSLLIQVLRGECIPWAEGLLASGWLAGVIADAKAEALREFALNPCDRNAVFGLTESAQHFGRTYSKLARDRAARIESEAGR